MKKIILLLFTIISYQIALSQCTPDPLYADSAWGIWPNEQTNFVSGDIGVAYQQIVNFKVIKTFEIFLANSFGLMSSTFELDLCFQKMEMVSFPLKIEEISR